jgi:formamidopyrimidine-DNA glycosylase
MPELPEVESFARSLSREYTKRPIKQVHFRRDGLRYPFDKKYITEVLAPQSFVDKFTRDGKQLIIRTDRGAIAVSLGMTGAFLPARVSAPSKHEHLTIEFSDKTALGFCDPRRFGFWVPYYAPLPHVADPLLAASLVAFFQSEQFRRSTRNIKDILLDQKYIGGIGNIYAAEALHKAKINPCILANKLSPKYFPILANAIADVLILAIANNGSSIATYRTLSGESGGFQQFHKVYDREGEPCLAPSCQGTIMRITQNGRSTWFCPLCQKRNT